MSKVKKSKKKPMSEAKKTENLVRKIRAGGTLISIKQQLALTKSNMLEVVQSIMISDRSDFEKWLGFQIEDFLYWAIETDILDKHGANQKLSKIAEEIKKKNKIKETFEYLVFLNEEMSKVDKANDYQFKAFIAMTDVVMQIITYFTSIENLPIRFNEDGKIIQSKSLYPLLDYHTFLYQNEFEDILRGNHESDFIDKLNKIGGYNFKNPFDIHVALQQENMVHIQLVLLSVLIDSDMHNFLVPPFYNPIHPPYVKDLLFDLTYCDMPDTIFEQNTEIHKLIPKQGIKYEGDFGEFKSIEIFETIKNNGRYLLYKLNSDDGSIFGFINLEKRFCFTIWREAKSNFGSEIKIEELKNTNNEIPLMLHHLISSLILYLYFDFVNINFSMPHIIRDRIDRVSFDIESEKDSITKRGVYSKGQYERELKHFYPSMRKLPQGWTASDEAHEKAKTLGRTIPDGYTFVSDHNRGLRVKSKK